MKRNHGIDAFRIFSMYMIVVLHVLGAGGVLSASFGSSGYVISCLIESLVFSAVNCYALISGFVGYSVDSKRNRYYKYAENWLQVVFYGVVITSILWKMNYIEDIKLIIRAFMPMWCYQYWYFCAYTGIFFIKPFLNNSVASLDERKTFRIVCVGFIIFSVLSSIWGDSLGLGEGYSFIWLCLLYCVGAVVKKYEIHKVIPTKISVIMIFLCVITTWVLKTFIGPLIYSYTGIDFFVDVFMMYTSPTMVLASVCLLLLFANLKVSSKRTKILSFVSSSTFGVYLIHVQPLFFNEILLNRYCWIGLQPAIYIPLLVLAISAYIFAACIMIDKVREKIFELLKIRSILEAMENKIRVLCMNIEDRVINYIKEKR